MDATTLLIILIVLLVLGGGGYWGRRRWFEAEARSTDWARANDATPARLPHGITFAGFPSRGHAASGIAWSHITAELTWP
jgi:hypothetical protein